MVKVELGVERSRVDLSTKQINVCSIGIAQLFENLSVLDGWQTRVIEIIDDLSLDPRSIHGTKKRPEYRGVSDHAFWDNSLGRFLLRCFLLLFRLLLFS